MAKIEGLVNVAIPDGYELCNCGKCSHPGTCFVRSVCTSCKQLPVLDKYYGSKCGCSPVLSEVDKAHLDNIEAARNAWEVSDRAVPFPDYWIGWQAATALIDERALRVSEQADIVEIDGVSYVDLGDCALIMNELAESRLREATLAGQLNAALQPTLDGEAFKQLRLENEALRTAVETLSGGLRLLAIIGSGTNLAGVRTVAKQTLNRAYGKAGERS